MDNLVDFNKYILKRANVKMCKRVLNEIITERNQNCKIYKTSDMEDIAKKILQEAEYENTTIVPIVDIAKQFNFDTFQQKLIWFLSGYIGINEKYKKKFNTDHIICTNYETNPYQQRFIIAHELAHFLFDYDHKSKVYYNTYIKNSHKEESERRANAFAANLLMPKKMFLKEYSRVVKINPDPIFVMVSLSEIFKAPRKSVLKRMSEVGCYACVMDKR